MATVPSILSWINLIYSLGRHEEEGQGCGGGKAKNRKGDAESKNRAERIDTGSDLFRLFLAENYLYQLQASLPLHNIGSRPDLNEHFIPVPLRWRKTGQASVWRLFRNWVCSSAPSLTGRGGREAFVQPTVTQPAWGRGGSLPRWLCECAKSFVRVLVDERLSLQLGARLVKYAPDRMRRVQPAQSTTRSPQMINMSRAVRGFHLAFQGFDYRVPPSLGTQLGDILRAFVLRQRVYID